MACHGLGLQPFSVQMRRSPNQQSDRSDAALLRAAVDDSAAFGVVYRRHAHRLVRAVLQSTRDEEVAIDIAAEAFARLLANAHRFRDDHDGSAWPWLVTVAKRLSIDAAEHRRVERTWRDRLGMQPRAYWNTTELDVEDRLDAHAAAATLQDALEELPPEQREALELRVLREQPYSEVAAAQGVAEPTARQRVARGLRTLHARLTEGGFSR
jgi:RNA polymerase sigma-70 factor (ECF subfamily)